MDPKHQGETPRSANELEDSWFNLRALQPKAPPTPSAPELGDPVADAWFIQ